MNNDFNRDQELEKRLKDKMNDLSSSLECFDKISARAFPKKEQDFSDDEFVITELETVTGKRKHISLLKALAAAAAAVVCIAILPKAGIIDRVIDDISPQSQAFNEILEELYSETNKCEYFTYDVPLDFYAKYDFLVTPYNSCPFEYSGESTENTDNGNNSDNLQADNNIMVRIFVKTIYDYQTQQIYAVEYCDNYDEQNIIAIAESKLKFDFDLGNNITENGNTDDSLQTQSSFDSINVFNEFQNSNVIPEIYSTLQVFCNHNDHNNLCDPDGNVITLAETSFRCLAKTSDNSFRPVLTSIIYGHYTEQDQDDYFYDMRSFTTNMDIVDTGERHDSWEKSVYRDGSSAAPALCSSSFTHMDIFDIQSKEVDPLLICSIDDPQFYTTPPDYDSMNVELYNSQIGSQGTIAEIKVPRFILLNTVSPYEPENFSIILTPYRAGNIAYSLAIGTLLKYNTITGRNLNAVIATVQTKGYLIEILNQCNYWLDDIEEELKSDHIAIYEEDTLSVKKIISFTNAISSYNEIANEKLLIEVKQKAGNILNEINELNKTSKTSAN